MRFWALALAATPGETKRGAFAPLPMAGAGLAPKWIGNTSSLKQLTVMALALVRLAVLARVGRG
jgi:hypothetical protein